MTMNIKDVEWQIGILRSAGHVFSSTMSEALVSAEYIVGTARQVTDSADQTTDELVKRLHLMQASKPARRFSFHTESCGCKETCDCPATILLCVDGNAGYGTASECWDGKLNKAVLQCRLLGWEFDAEDSYDAARKLEQRIHAVTGDSTIKVYPD